MKNLFTFLIVLFIFSACNTNNKEVQNNETDTINKISEITNVLEKKDEPISSYTDTRDGKKYKTVKIGDKIWLAENFAYKVPEAKYGGFDGNYWAYDDNEENVAKYGYLYDWETARKVAPEGWHLPSKTEFDSLINYYGENAFEKLSNKDGLNIIYSGWFYDESGFVKEGNELGFWSSTPVDDKQAWACIFEKEWEHVFVRSRYTKGVGASVRLVKD